MKITVNKCDCFQCLENSLMDILKISIGFKQEEFYWQNASLNIFEVGFVVVR